jgi:hypothetical protein
VVLLLEMTGSWTLISSDDARVCNRIRRARTIGEPAYCQIRSRSFRAGFVWLYTGLLLIKIFSPRQDFSPLRRREFLLTTDNPDGTDKTSESIILFLSVSSGLSVVKNLLCISASLRWKLFWLRREPRWDLGLGIWSFLGALHPCAVRTSSIPLLHHGRIKPFRFAKPRAASPGRAGRHRSCETALSQLSNPLLRIPPPSPSAELLRLANGVNPRTGQNLKNPKKFCAQLISNDRDHPAKGFGILQMRPSAMRWRFAPRRRRSWLVA